MQETKSQTIVRAQSELKRDGVTLLPDIFSKAQCEEYVTIFDRIIEKSPADTKNRINPEVQSVNNYFRHDGKLMELIYIPILDELFKILINEDHVLIAANSFNRRKSEIVNQNLQYEHSRNAGHNWHIDSDYVGGVRLDSGFSYQVIIMLEDFTADNGATQYVKDSHKDRSRPDRMGDYPFELITGNAGTVGVIDSGLWHRSGDISQRSRWGIFNTYGPWFVKPYFRFPEMLGEETGSQLGPQLRRLLHYRSIPPLDEQDRLNTVVREEES